MYSLCLLAEMNFAQICTLLFLDPMVSFTFHFVFLFTQTPQGLVHKLVHIDKPILKVPNICIHLAHADVHREFSPNKETHM